MPLRFTDEGGRFCTVSAGKEGGRKRKLGDGGHAAGQTGGADRAQQAFNRVVNYCVAERCRRATLLAHFGERLQQPCSGCDWCLDRHSVSQQVHPPPACRLTPKWHWLPF
jgi:hypothetical protein